MENKGDNMETAGLLSSINNLPGSVPTVIFFIVVGEKMGPVFCLSVFYNLSLYVRPLILM